MCVVFFFSSTTQFTTVSQRFRSCKSRHQAVFCGAVQNFFLKVENREMYSQKSYL